MTIVAQRFLLIAGLLSVAGWPGSALETSTQQREQDTTIEGLDELSFAGLVLLLGEIHGTADVPERFGDVIDHALAQGVPVRVGLELPAQEQATVDAALAAKDEAGAEERIASSTFFRRRNQDGRSSLAMARLILRLRLLAKADADIQVVCFDQSGHPQRDRVMAERIAAIHTADPTAACLVLTGNAHARREKKEHFPFTPMGAHLVEAGVEFVSFRAVSSGGSAWVCQPGNECGPLRIGGQDLGSKPFLALGTPDVPAGYDGICYVGRVEASPPFIDSVGVGDD